MSILSKLTNIYMAKSDVVEEVVVEDVSAPVEEVVAPVEEVVEEVIVTETNQKPEGYVVIDGRVVKDPTKTGVFSV
jgi:hypothetical protein